MDVGGDSMGLFGERRYELINNNNNTLVLVFLSFCAHCFCSSTLVLLSCLSPW